ncbi:response regulator [Pseudomonas oryzae]|uniref:Putative two-component system response regulator n=1 Tax=Pseudomonas oryzae TaxID=1392877 RepID=A0A1H1R5V9_9PSED|nr:two-component system response regulator [Pseudomonas oryzae]SDS31113.1 putative two-component system response regulator [Pseudomonas oryzae]
MDTPNKPTILVVDDNPNNLVLISSLLRNDYRVKVANSGEAALRIAGSAEQPDLILLDIMMPEMDGYEVCQRLKADAQLCDIPVIFLTARTSVDDEEHGLHLGAVDYITKPISPPVMLARVQTQLKLKASADFLRNKSEFLEREVQKRVREVLEVQDITIEMMASLAETRDNETGNHIRRTQNYVRALARHLQKHPRFAGFLSDANIQLLFKTAPMHDIGKIGIPDSILLKPGRLDAQEFHVMQSHASLGGEAIARAERLAGREVPFLRIAREIAQSHHEKWDGTGYPQGLGGDDIPISARLMALADVYDALISSRVYKTAMSHDEAVKIICAGKGSHFDPDMVDAFLELQDVFRAIAERYADNTESPHNSPVEA